MSPIKLISVLSIPAALMILVFAVSCTKKLKASKDMNFYNIKTIDDLHSLFPTSPEQIKEYAQACMKLIDEQVAKIIEIPHEERNFENTARELDKISLIAGPIVGAISSLEYLNPDKIMRETAQAQGIMINDYLVDHVTSNVNLYKAFKSYAEGNSLQENLTEKERYFVDQAMHDFKKAGLELPQEELDKVSKINKELNVLSTQFQMNIAAHKCKIPVSLEELEGTTESFINALQQDEDGKYLLGCDYPTYFAIMDQCKVESTRKKMYTQFSNRAYPQNIDLLNQIISKRDELSKLLGFNSFADLSIKDQMAKSSENVENFLNDLAEKAQKKALQEIQMFVKELPDSISLQDGKIKPWDFRYIKETYRKKHLSLDDSKIAEYFPMQHTIDELFDIYQKFFSLRFEKVDAVGFWHQDVQLIKIYNKDGDFLGYLFLDLFPREDKFSHAANATIVHAYKGKNGENYPAVCIMIANFPKQSKEKPSLLTYKDVVTFFHEFGHGLHAMLGGTELVSFSGTNVKRDFVEMPSQMLENWLKDNAILKKVSSHYKTQEPLPEELIEKIVELDKLDSGDQILRQCYYAFLSLELFKEGQSKDIQKISQELFKKLIKHIEWQENDHTPASFGHLMGYGASYYGYLWSNVFAVDLFEQIKLQGLLDPEVGQKYISEVLSQGGSKDPNILLNNFLGRDPNQDAYLKSLGFE
ncbi:MAG: Zn-dependent oligopeptidase [Candidatus Babeliales bacterium]|nr:Zn-dependent oligopeptidase [Candidatus Babeliales bacterium]